ncbi:hypothetical protein [Erythrobacter sp. HKB08]|nr:hypothetical protein [Erythrobacter sp. HKB08]
MSQQLKFSATASILAMALFALVGGMGVSVDGAALDLAQPGYEQFVQVAR